MLLKDRLPLTDTDRLYGIAAKTTAQKVKYSKVEAGVTLDQ